MFKPIRAFTLALSVFLLSLTMSAAGQTGGTGGGSGTSGTGSSAQTSGQYTGSNTESSDRQYDWGWVGLLGLVGLTGFFRRREEAHPSRIGTPDTTGSR